MEPTPPWLQPDTLRKPDSHRRKVRIPKLAWAFVFIGGFLQGVGSNVDRFADSSGPWAVLGGLIGLMGAAWIARGLRWWLLLFVPVVWLMIAPIAVWSQLQTIGLVSRVINRESAACEGWGDVAAELEAIAVTIQRFSTEVVSTEQPTAEDDRQRAIDADAIRRQFEAVDAPPALDRYVELSISIFRDYEQGFEAMAEGDYGRGQALLDQGDAARGDASAVLRAANAECVG